MRKSKETLQYRKRATLKKRKATQNGITEFALTHTLISLKTQATGALQPAAAVRLLKEYTAVSVEPGSVELCLFLDASVQLEHFSNCHSCIR